MLDIRFIRENAELVAEKSKQKGYVVDINELLKRDESRRSLLKEVEELRQKRNEVTEKIKTSAEKLDSALVNEGKRIKDEITTLEATLRDLEKSFLELLKQVPNLSSDDVPVGNSEAQNVVSKEWGDKPQFDFSPKTHWQLAEERDLIDKQRAAKVAGSRFAYIKGDLVKLQFALIQFVMDTLTSEEEIKKIIQQFGLSNVSSKPFIPILPPLMIRTEVYDAMDRLEPRDDRYKVGEDQDNMWLQGSAEHTLGPMYAGETIELTDQPLRYLGYATSFRREAGTYGKETEGIIRMHQFDKLEMESFTSPSAGMSEHLFLIAVQEYLMQQLGLVYRVLQKCTADIGKPNARGIDLEVWLPGDSRFLETHTADYMTDYQARRLGTKIRQADGPLEYVHTNDATALALGRTLVAIIENYQTNEGMIRIPEVLKPYLKGVEQI